MEIYAGTWGVAIIMIAIFASNYMHNGGDAFSRRERVVVVGVCRKWCLCSFGTLRASLHRSSRRNRLQCRYDHPAARTTARTSTSTVSQTRAFLSCPPRVIDSTHQPPARPPLTRTAMLEREDNAIQANRHRTVCDPMLRRNRYLEGPGPQASVARNSTCSQRIHARARQQ